MIEEKSKFAQRTNPTNSWVTYNPILLKGEIGYEVTNDGLVLEKVGDGETPWNRLPYHQPKTDTTLSLTHTAADAYSVGLRLGSLEERVSIIEKPKIEIVDFSCTPTQFELGNTITQIVFSWSYDGAQNLVSQSIDGVSIPINSRTYTLTSQSITQTTSFTLTATDTEGVEVSKTVYIIGLPTLQYGAATEPQEYTSEFIGALTKKIYNGADTSVTINATNNKYSYICYPIRYGVKHLLYNGIEGGFNYQTTVSYTNTYGYTENYYIYRSDYPNLGSTKIFIRGEII